MPSKSDAGSRVPSGFFEPWTPLISLSLVGPRLVPEEAAASYPPPAADGPKISYPLAVIKESKHAEAARKFAAFLAGPKARAVFERFGFLMGR